MAEGSSVTIVDGKIRIDHPEIEAGLHVLAARWQMTVADALGTALRHELDASQSDDR